MGFLDTITDEGFSTANEETFIVTEIQLSFTRAHSKGLGQIMPYSEAALLPT